MTLDHKISAKRHTSVWYVDLFYTRSVHVLPNLGWSKLNEIIKWMCFSLFMFKYYISEKGRGGLRCLQGVGGKISQNLLMWYLNAPLHICVNVFGSHPEFWRLSWNLVLPSYVIYQHWFAIYVICQRRLMTYVSKDIYICWYGCLENH